MGILLLGLAVGWPLMWATISVEGTDSFDALSRTYAYVYQRPLHYLWYAAIAGGLGVLAGLLITIFAGAIVYLSLWCASWTAGATSTARIAAQLPQGIVGVSRFADSKAGGLASPDAASTPVAVPLTTTPTVSTAPIEPTSAAKSGLEIGPAGEATSGIFRAGVAVLSFWLAAVQVLLLGFGFSYFWTATTGIYLLLRQDVDATEMDVIHLEDEPATFGLPPLENDAAGVAVVAEEEDASPTQTSRETKSASATPASQ